MSEAYIPLIIYLTVALLIPVSINLVVYLLNRRNHSASDSGSAKTSSYEGGYPTQAMTGRFPVKFYLVAMLFVIFDVEAAAFYPWALQLRELGVYALLEMIAFLVVLAIGYAYVWRKGGFQWR